MRYPISSQAFLVCDRQSFSQRLVMNWDLGCLHFVDTQTVHRNPFLPLINGVASLSDYQGPTGLSCPHIISEWQLELEYPPCMRKISSSSLEWHIHRIPVTWRCAVSPISRGQYRRLPAEGWGSGLDLGPGWRQMQGGVDDPTRGLLRKGVWMARGGLRLEGSGLLAAP